MIIKMEYEKEMTIRNNPIYVIIHFLCAILFGMQGSIIGLQSSEKFRADISYS